MRVEKRTPSTADLLGMRCTRRSKETNPFGCHWPGGLASRKTRQASRRLFAPRSRMLASFLAAKISPPGVSHGDRQGRERKTH